MPWEVFEELNREKRHAKNLFFANPRNAASGTLKLQNSAIVASRKLDAYLYYLLGEELRFATDIMKTCRKLHNGDSKSPTI